MSALDSIRQRAAELEPYDESLCDCNGCDAQRDRARLLAALDAVLALHAPVDALMYGGKSQAHKVQVCTGCGQDNGNWNRYPCPTVRAVNDALEATA